MNSLLKGKVAIVTGAARGIGRATALKVASHGARVALTDIRGDELADTRARIEASGGSARHYQADLTDDAAVSCLVAQVRDEFGTIDVLVNIAGISVEMPLNEMPMDVWDRIVDTNLRAVALLTKNVLPTMIERGSGNICSIASASALRGLPGSTAYSAAKAGVVALTQALGDEVRSHNIRVNVICPGPVDTELFRKSAKHDFILAAGGDVFRPETIANAVLYLVSPLSEGMSSQVLTIRGLNRW
ncbi:MAG: SDR family oxidoreductase [Bifidobacteriaceae bacterium]|jgi:NAD(P)-dependent dehydrogenase (short-subunit alcohol dehydrogenase family)|nr:SDR family oxidoreductase [Bifidobacteriaceae bacterium]